MNIHQMFIMGQYVGLNNDVSEEYEEASFDSRRWDEISIELNGSIHNEDCENVQKDHHISCGHLDVGDPFEEFAGSFTDFENDDYE